MSKVLRNTLRSCVHLATFRENCSLVKCFSSSSPRCRAKIIDGVKIARDIRNELKAEVDEWVALGNRQPHLTAILVGEDQASHAYVSAKMKAAKYVGITSETIKLPATISEPSLLSYIDQLNNDNGVDGILVQLPLPDHITERAICNAVTPHKDVDGFHIVNVGRFCLDMKTLVPCTPLGVHELIKRSGETGAMDATTTICHRYTPAEQLAMLTRTADIIVTAVGIPNLIRADMVKEGVCIIDVGITRVKDEKTGKDRLVGDVDFDAVVEKAGHITPVPGGVGPMTVAMLMKNTLLAARKEVVYNILDPGAVVQKKASQLRP